MSRGLNQVSIIGHLGKDPEVRYLPSGQPVANFSVATTESWKDKEGEKQEQTEWHTIAIFGPLADVAGTYLKKGSRVFLQGSLRTRKWQDKEGNDRYTTEVIAKEMVMLDPPSNSSRDDQEPRRGTASSRGKPAAGRGAPASTRRRPSEDGETPYREGNRSKPRRAQPEPQDEEPDFDDDLEIPI